jgi:hypothetical protein
VPDPGNPQSWDRYAGMNNNPVRYNDPSGHLACSDAHVASGDCSDEGVGLWRFNVTFTGGCTQRNKEVVRTALVNVGTKYAQELGGTSWGALQKVHGAIKFEWDPGCVDCNGGGGVTETSHHIIFASLTLPGGNRTDEMAFTSARNNVVHELGHSFAQGWYRKDGSYGSNGPYVNMNDNLLVEGGFHESPVSANRTWRQNPDISPTEIFADMFLGWTYDTWADNKVGIGRDNFMTTNMAEWLKGSVDLRQPYEARPLYWAVMTC